MKTIKEWLQQLDEPYRSQALKNMYDQARVDSPSYRLDMKFETLSDALNRAFVWSLSPERFIYWQKIHNLYENENS